MQQMPRLTATLTTENPSGLQPVAWTPRGDEVCLLVAATVVPAGVVRGMRGGVRCSARWSAGDSGAARSVLTAPGVCVHACARAGLSACARRCRSQDTRCPRPGRAQSRKLLRPRLLLNALLPCRECSSRWRARAIAARDKRAAPWKAREARCAGWRGLERLGKRDAAGSSLKPRPRSSARAFSLWEPCQRLFLRLASPPSESDRRCVRLPPTARSTQNLTPAGTVDRDSAVECQHGHTREPGRERGPVVALG